MKRKSWLVLLLCALLFSGCEKQPAPEESAIAIGAATKPPHSETLPPEAADPPLMHEPQSAENTVTARPAVSDQIVDSGTDDGVNWYLTKSDAGYALHVSGETIPEKWLTGVARFTNTDNNGGNSIIHQIKSLNVDNHVVRIGGRAFSGCSELTDVTFGTGVEETGDQLFMDCNKLYQVQFTGRKVPAEALMNNTAVQEVVLSPDCREIGPKAFSNCTALRKVKGAGASLLILNDYTFSGCTALGEVPDLSGLRIMGAGAFEGCTAIKQVTFPESLTGIGPYAFKGCAGLTDLRFPRQGDLQIGNNAFENCTALSRVEMTGAVYSIGDNAFRACSSLTFLSLGGQSSMGDNVLSDCSNVTVTVYGSLPAEALKNSTAVSTVIFSGNRVIAKEAFSGCTALKELIFTEETPVVIIGDQAFFGCSGLTEVELCQGLEEIGSKAFADCSGMEKITLPKSLKKVGSALFANNARFMEAPRKAICYAGNKAGWNAVEKPAPGTGTSWNAGLTTSDWQELEITCLNK